MGLPDFHRHDGHAKTPAYPQLSRKFVARRISEGETGRLKEELKCQACGKGYKHVSSLAKHLWEHTPEWNVTSKLLISKHQQVQLLEAASILVSMNEEDEEQDEAGDEAGEAEPGADPAGDEPRPNTKPRPAVKAEPVAAAPQEPGRDPRAVNESSAVAEAAPAEAAQGLSDLHHAAPAPAPSDDRYLTPAREIPILSTASRPIAKTPARGHRRRSSANQHQLAGSLASSLGSYGTAGPLSTLDAHLRQASPLPESLLAKDLPNAHLTASRRRRTSTLHPLGPASVPRGPGLVDSHLDPLDDDDEEGGYDDGHLRGRDGLQDPQEPELDTPRTPKHSPRPRKASPKKEDVFGMEV